MSSKADLQRKLNDLGYVVGPFASKETLSNIVRLHSLVSIHQIVLLLFNR